MPSAQRRFPPPWSVVPRELEVDWREGVAMREAVIVAIAGALLCFLLSPAAREREQRAEVAR